MIKNLLAVGTHLIETLSDSTKPIVTLSVLTHRSHVDTLKQHAAVAQSGASTAEIVVESLRRVEIQYTIGCTEPHVSFGVFTHIIVPCSLELKAVLVADGIESLGAHQLACRIAAIIDNGDGGIVATCIRHFDVMLLADCKQ